MTDELLSVKFAQRFFWGGLGKTKVAYFAINRIEEFDRIQILFLGNKQFSKVLVGIC